MSWGGWELVRVWETVVILRGEGEVRPIASWPTETEALEHALHLTSPFRSIYAVAASSVVPVARKRWNPRIVDPGARERGQA